VDFSHNRIHSLGPATFTNQVQLQGWPSLSLGFAKLENCIKSDKAWLATFLSNRTRCVDQQGTGELAYQVQVRWPPSQLLKGGLATFINQVQGGWPTLPTGTCGLATFTNQVQVDWPPLPTGTVGLATFTNHV
jgi:hypothetical protein